MIDKKSQKCSRFSIDILFRGNVKLPSSFTKKKARITIGDRDSGAGITCRATFILSSAEAEDNVFDA